MPYLYPRASMVVPVWYPQDADPALVDNLLNLTLDGVEIFCRPENVILVLDGQERWHDAVLAQAQARGFRFHFLSRNLGKGGAVAAGIEQLQEVEHDFVVTRDSDGDHLIFDLPSLLQVGYQMLEECGEDLIIVSGSRGDRVPPLGLERGEYEHVTDRFLWQALQYYAAQERRAISSAYFALYNDYPDFQTGYKAYSARAARIAAASLGEVCADDEDLSRCGVETLPAVDIMAAGGEIGVVMRRTYQEQPVSGYRGLDAVRMYARPLLWACRRLRLPLEVAATLLDDAILRSPLLYDHDRREKLLAVRCHVLQGLGADRPLRTGPRFF